VKSRTTTTYCEPDRHEVERERWAAYAALATTWKPPGCAKHIHALDARGRCPLCDGFGSRPELAPGMRPDVPEVTTC